MASSVTAPALHCARPARRLVVTVLLIVDRSLWLAADSSERDRSCWRPPARAADSARVSRNMLSSTSVLSAAVRVASSPLVANRVEQAWRQDAMQGITVHDHALLDIDPMHGQKG